MGKAARKVTPKLRGRLRPITLGLLPELLEQVDAVAQAEHRSRTNMIEIMIRDWLADRQRQQGRAA